MSRLKNLLLVMLAVCGCFTARAAETNSLVWLADRDLVSADIHREALWPLLEDIAHQTLSLADEQLALLRGHDAGGILPAVLQHRQCIVETLVDGT